MKGVSFGLALVLALAAHSVLALPGTFHIDEIYSNADGTVWTTNHDGSRGDVDDGASLHDVLAWQFGPPMLDP